MSQSTGWWGGRSALVPEHRGERGVPALSQSTGQGGDLLLSQSTGGGAPALSQSTGEMGGLLGERADAFPPKSEGSDACLFWGYSTAK